MNPYLTTISNTDVEFLVYLRDRLIHYYKEHPMSNNVLSLNRIIGSAATGTRRCVNGGCRAQVPIASPFKKCGKCRESNRRYMRGIRMTAELGKTT